MTHFISASCEGSLCSVCKAPSTHKLGEEIPIAALMCDHAKQGSADNCTLVLTATEKAFLKKWYAVIL